MGGPPADIKDKAIEVVTSQCGKGHYIVECRDAKIIVTEKKPLTDADKLNGIVEKWCIQVHILYRHSSEWSEGSFGVYAERKNGKLNVYKDMGCRVDLSR